MVRIRLFVFILLANVVGSVYSAAVLPISVIATPDGIPLGVIVGMKSKPEHFVALQVDTGSITNLLFETSGKPDMVDERLQQLSTHSEKPIFLGDSGKRMRISLSSEYRKFNEVAALVSVPKHATDVVGVLGLDWFRDKVIELSFKDRKMKIIDSFEPSYSSATSIFLDLELKVGLNRIQFDICRPLCESIIFDTGITIADIVEFVPMRALAAMGVPDEFVHISGVLGPVKCRRPIKSNQYVLIGGRRIKGLYQTVCAFLESPESVPDRTVLGIRSIIEAVGSILIDLNSSRIKLDYRRPNIHDE